MLKAPLSSQYYERSLATVPHKDVVSMEIYRHEETVIAYMSNWEEMS